MMTHSAKEARWQKQQGGGQNLKKRARNIEGSS